jgi:hypothetical protein
MIVANRRARERVGATCAFTHPNGGKAREIL